MSTNYWSEGNDSAIPQILHDHAVQFYESAEFLAQTVGNFVADGVSAGDPVVIIATQEHRATFTAELMRRSLLGGSSDVKFLDAHDSLDLFMIDGMPSAELFRQHIGGTIGRASESARSKVRAYGEMVDVLW